MADCENKRFGVKMMRSATPLEDHKLSLYWRFEFDGETYGDYLLFSCRDDRFEVPVDKFVDGAIHLRRQMELAAEELRKARNGAAETGDCKWCLDEFCTNDQCPMCCDFCPVANDPGVCRYEEREG